VKALVVYAHPNPKSFNAAILKSFTSGLSEAGHSYEVVDLYSEGFDPVLKGDDFAAFESGMIPADIASYQEKISGADALVLICPVWWFSVPAMLKGWIDRVFSSGFAYSINPDGSIQGLLGRVKKTLMIQTCGGKKEAYETYGFKDAVSKCVDDGVLRFCAMPQVEHVFLYDVIMATPEVREGYLQLVERLGKEF